jgi:hypothetical protein
VFFSKLDWTGGMVGTASRMCLGYEPRTAMALVRNLVLYAAAGKTQAASSETP